MFKSVLETVFEQIHQIRHSNTNTNTSLNNYSNTNTNTYLTPSLMITQKNLFIAPTRVQKRLLRVQ